LGEFTGQVAVVTGSGGGLGRAIVQGLLDADAHVVGLDIDEQSDSFDGHRGSFEAVRCDVTSLHDVKAAVPARVDLCVAAAGAFPNRPLADWTPEQFESLWRLNVLGVFNVLSAVEPVMRRRRSGRIVLISSQAVFQGIPGFIPYAATKAALIGMARSAAAELADDGIRVNVVTPGLTATKAAIEGDVGAFFDHVVESQMLKRRQQAEDVVGPVLFLCRDESDFVTGQIINVDGGAVTH
jgi:NAD(P)-dependent dehydrogenase (short-subunit alcohol dehydrogenase family)